MRVVLKDRHERQRVEPLVIGFERTRERIPVDDLDAFIDSVVEHRVECLAGVAERLSDGDVVAQVRQGQRKRLKEAPNVVDAPEHIQAMQCGNRNLMSAEPLAEVLAELETLRRSAPAMSRELTLKFWGPLRSPLHVLDGREVGPFKVG